MLFTSAGNSNGGKYVRQSTHRQSCAAKMHPLTYAALAVRGGLVAGVTGTLKGSCHVDALAVLAQVFTQLALVHI